jgi:Ca-activated chloride channel family protein
VRDVDGFRRIAENRRRMGAAVTTIGVDVSYDEKVMSVLARNSNGHHFSSQIRRASADLRSGDGLAHEDDRESRRATVDLAPGVFAEHVYDRGRAATAAS